MVNSENGQVCCRQSNTKPKKNIWNVAYHYFSEFCDNTSMAGFKFLVENKRYTIEKLWWLVVLCACFYFCSILILVTLQKWDENPIFISIRANPLRIWDVPFPAITICPGIKIAASNYNYTTFMNEYYAGNLTNEELQKWLDINLLCRGFQRKNNIQQSDHDTTFKHLVENAFSLLSEDIDIQYSAELDGENFFLSPIFTDRGLCFSFNMLDRTELFSNVTYFPDNFVLHPNISNWSVDDNYVKTTNETYPARITNTRNMVIFETYLASDEDTSHCNTNVGLRILVHHPAEAPILWPDEILVGNTQVTTIKLKAEATISTSNLKNYSPLKKGCYFSQERRLKFFKIYTEHNCRIECLSNYTLHRCGCVEYYLPHETSTKICVQGSDRNCALEVKDQMGYVSMENAVWNIESSSQDKRFCNCLPSCTSVTYQAEIEEGTNISTDFHIEMLSYFIFKDHILFTKERNELYSTTDIWANCGGIFGLFTGFSVVSLAEIIYFCSLRWLCNVWNLIQGRMECKKR